jgi:hypothetical protein
MFSAIVSIGHHLTLVIRLVDNELQNELATPHRSLTDHTLQITDIQCGVGTFLTCRILTSSVDHTAKVSFSDLVLVQRLTKYHSSGIYLLGHC